MSSNCRAEVELITAASMAMGLSVGRSQALAAQVQQCFRHTASGVAPHIPGAECGVLARLPQEEKVAEVERELNEAQHRVEGAKGAYELIVRRMAEELVRFQRERASELAAVLRSFAAAQTQLAGDTAKVRAVPPRHR